MYHSLSFFDARAIVYCIALLRTHTDDIHELDILLQKRSWQGEEYLCLPAGEVFSNESSDEGLRRILTGLIPMPYRIGHAVQLDITNQNPITLKEMEWDGKPAVLRLLGISVPFEESEPCSDTCCWYDLRSPNPHPDVTYEMLERSEGFRNMFMPLVECRAAS